MTTLEILNSKLSMSQFASKADMIRELLEQREVAATAIAELVTWLTYFAHADLDDADEDGVTVGQAFQEDALRLIAKHKAVQP